MFESKKNNVWFNIGNSLTANTSSTLLTILGGKETLSGVDFGINDTTKHFKLTLVKFVGGVASITEVVKVISKSLSALTIVRAYEPCPLNANATIMTQSPQVFDVGDFAYMNMTASDLIELGALVDSKLDKSGGTMTGVLKLAKGNSIASATTVDLSSATGNYLHITGTTTITSFGSVNAGTEFCLVFDGSLVLTHNVTSLILPTSANITTQAGDIAYFKSEGGGNWICTGYQKKDGSSLTTASIKSTEKELIAGESINIGNALCMPKYLNTYISQLTGTPFYDGGTHSHGQTIDCSGMNILYNFVKYYYCSSTGNAGILMQVYSSPGGTLLGTYGCPSQLYVGGNYYSYNFITNLDITGYSSLYIFFYSGVSFINSLSTTSNLYSGGQRYLDGNPASGDLKFEVNMLKSNTKVFKTNATDIYKTTFIGFALNTVNTGDNIRFCTAGVDNNQSGLIPGENYYLSNTPGSISLTPGTNIVNVGIAVDTNSIEINLNRIKQLIEIIPTIGASPYTYQNITGRVVIVSITGGAVSQIAYSRDNINYYQTASNTNDFIILGINDYVKITYSSTPIVKVFTF